MSAESVYNVYLLRIVLQVVVDVQGEIRRTSGVVFPYNNEIDRCKRMIDLVIEYKNGPSAVRYGRILYGTQLFF